MTELGLDDVCEDKGVMDVLLATYRTDVARQSLSDALREGLLNHVEASSFRICITQTPSASSPSTGESQVKVHDAATSCTRRKDIRASRQGTGRGEEASSPLKYRFGVLRCQKRTTRLDIRVGGLFPLMARACASIKLASG